MMPSRKKAKGKARKAAKEAEAAKAEEESQAVILANQVQKRSLEAQIERLIINAVSPKLCRHGCPSPSLSPDDLKMFKDFINAYIDVFRTTNKVAEGCVTAYEATEDEYAEVYASKLDTVISLLLARGTHCILDGDNSQARTYAFLASHFEEILVLCLYRTKTTANSTNPTELGRADDHTLVSYYRKRIPCGCLDEKYKEVKSVKKMGMCYNPNCSLPDHGRVERSKMFSCARCGDVNYCSVECQRADWKKHKQYCVETAEKKAELNAEQS